MGGNMKMAGGGAVADSWQQADAQEAAKVAQVDYSASGVALTIDYIPGAAPVVTGR